MKEEEEEESFGRNSASTLAPPHALIIFRIISVGILSTGPSIRPDLTS